MNTPFAPLGLIVLCFHVFYTPFAPLGLRILVSTFSTHLSPTNQRYERLIAFLGLGILAITTSINIPSLRDSIYQNQKPHFLKLTLMEQNSNPHLTFLPLFLHSIGREEKKYKKFHFFVSNI